MNWKLVLFFLATAGLVAGPVADADARQSSKVVKKQKAGKKHIVVSHRVTGKRTIKVNFVSKVVRKKSKKSTAGKPRLASLFPLSSVSARSPRNGGAIYSGGRYLGSTIVPFKRKLKPGTILVKTSERALYYVLPGGKAVKYGVGVGREGFTWRGRHRITMKKEWPEWRPPAEMRERERKKYGRELPEVMEGGPRNPLGARALYIGNTLYRIHGTNNPRSIGHNVSSGCIRMVNSEVIDLYNRVKTGARVIVE